jgi:autophagy-related protein 2
VRPVEEGSHVVTTLAESMISVAEEFVADEMTPQEEATLMHSIHEELTEVQSIPGSLDGNNPFKASPDEPEYEPNETPEVDPSGVSIFATLIERLLARFEFDAANIRITLIHPGNMSFSLVIDQLTYRGNTNQFDLAGNKGDSHLKHTLSMTGIKITTRDLKASETSSLIGSSHLCS